MAHAWEQMPIHKVEDQFAMINQSLGVLERFTGTRPVGWMTGRPGPNTRRLLVEAGGFLYDRDALNDELPYWLNVAGRPHLAVGPG